MPKRKRQPPSPLKTKAGTWGYDFWVKGRRFQGNVGSGSAKEAAAAVERVWNAAREASRLSSSTGADIVVTVGRQEDVAAKQVTVAEVFARHWNTRAHKLAGASDAMAMMELIVEILGEKTPWCEIGNDAIGRFVDERQKMGKLKWKKVDGVKVRVRIGDISGAAINRYLAFIQAAHTRARDEWEIPTKPVKWSLHQQDESRMRIRALTEDEAERIYGLLPNHIRVAMMFALVTGVRKNEMRTLTWDRVDFDGRRMHVIAKGLGGKTRAVPLGKQALAILSGLPRPSSAADMSRSLVFDLVNMRRIWEKALRDAGVTDFRWHDLRHTFATWLGRQGGIKIETLSKVLGHSSIQVTMRYRHVLSDELQDAVDAFPDVSKPKVIEADLAPQAKKKSDKGEAA